MTCMYYSIWSGRYKLLARPTVHGTQCVCEWHVHVPTAVGGTVGYVDTDDRVCAVYVCVRAHCTLVCTVAVCAANDTMFTNGTGGASFCISQPYTNEAFTTAMAVCANASGNPLPVSHTSSMWNVFETERYGQPPNVCNHYRPPFSMNLYSSNTAYGQVWVGFYYNTASQTYMWADGTTYNNQTDQVVMCASACTHLCVCSCQARSCPRWHCAIRCPASRRHVCASRALVAIRSTGILSRARRS